MYTSSYTRNCRAFKDAALGLLRSALEAMCGNMLPLGVEASRLTRLQEQV